MADIIACLGWGSLVWDPSSLPISGIWHEGGPFVNVEFARQSADDRLTLVVVSEARPVRVLWAAMDASLTLDQAADALRKREWIPARNAEHIGRWSKGESEPHNLPGLAVWAESRGVTAVIWTALPPKFNGKNGIAPTVSEAIDHLRSLSGRALREAKRYVQRAPPQIDTEYRQRFEAELGWHPVDSNGHAL